MVLSNPIPKISSSRLFVHFRFRARKLRVIRLLVNFSLDSSSESWLVRLYPRRRIDSGDSSGTFLKAALGRTTEHAPVSAGHTHDPGDLCPTSTNNGP